MSADRIFIDSNILVYMFDATNLGKRQHAVSLVNRLVEDETGCISYQVVQETLNVVIGKLGIAHERVRQFMDDILIPLWDIYPTPTLYQNSIEVRERFGFSFYDSLIIAAALEAECNLLYTEDMQHGQQIRHLTIHNPFAA